MTSYMDLRLSLEQMPRATRSWRRLRVSSQETLAGLHLAIQRMVGATGRYYYEFEAGGIVFGPAIENGFPDWQGQSPVDVSKVTLAEVFRQDRTRLYYDYDIRRSPCSPKYLLIELEACHQEGERGGAVELLEAGDVFLNERGRPVLWENTALEESRGVGHPNDGKASLIRAQQARSRDEPGVICSEEWVSDALGKGAHLPGEVPLDEDGDTLGYLEDQEKGVVDLETGEEMVKDIPGLWVPPTPNVDGPQLTKNEPHTLFVALDYVLDNLLSEMLARDWVAMQERIVDDLLEAPPESLSDRYLYHQVVSLGHMYRKEHRLEHSRGMAPVQMAADYEGLDHPGESAPELSAMEQQMVGWVAGFDGYVNVELLSALGCDGERADWLQSHGRGLVARLRRAGRIELQPMTFGKRDFSVVSVKD